MRKHWCTGILPGIAALLLSGFQVSAKTIIHPADGYGSIMEAMAAASPGEEIMVEPGVYTENIVMKAGVKLWAASPDVTILQAAVSANPVVLFNQPNQDRSTRVSQISGFKIQGGNIGIKVDIQDAGDQKPAYVTIDGNWITDNESYGIELYVLNGGPHYIVNNLVTRHRDAGIVVNSRTHILNNTVDRNGFPDDGIQRTADGIQFFDQKANGSSLVNNIVTNNEGNGLFIFYITGVLNVNVSPILSNDFHGNGVAQVDAAPSYSIIGYNGNISQPPQFRSSSSAAVYDYMPLAASPCVDTGVNDNYNFVLFPKDLMQGPGGRLYPSGETIDMGAVEYNPRPFGQQEPTATPSRTPTITPTPSPTISADINGDGYIDQEDLFLMIRQWHSITPTPSAP